MEPDETDLVTAAEAARILEAPRKRIKTYEDSGKLHPVKVERVGLQRKPYFRRSDVEALRDQHIPSTEA